MKPTDTFPCRGEGCDNRLPKRGTGGGQRDRLCGDCWRAVAEMLARAEAVRHPPPPGPYQPRVVRVLRDR